MRLVDFLPLMYGVGLATMLLNQKNRRLGDFVAGTVVVREEQGEQLRTYVDVARGAATVSADVASLAREELLLVETFLQRRLELDPNVSAEMAETISRRIEARTGTPRDPSSTPQDFLEAVARRIRENARF